MRILPYESVAVKVRVEARALKLGHFLTFMPRNRVCSGRVGRRTVEFPRANSLLKLAIQAIFNPRQVRSQARHGSQTSDFCRWFDIASTRRRSLLSRSTGSPL